MSTSPSRSSIFLAIPVVLLSVSHVGKKQRKERKGKDLSKKKNAVTNITLPFSIHPHKSIHMHLQALYRLVWLALLWFEAPPLQKEKRERVKKVKGGTWTMRQPAV
jgi:hypothetical protein